MIWKMLTTTVVRHLCPVFTTRDDEGNQQGRMVLTSFPEERCPYCKHAPPERAPEKLPIVV